MVKICIWLLYELTLALQDANKNNFIMVKTGIVRSVGQVILLYQNTL